MRMARCPHCGREYVDDGLMTICPGCQRELPPPEPPKRPETQPAGASAEDQREQPSGPAAPPVSPGPPPPPPVPPPVLSTEPTPAALNLAYWALGLGIAGILCCSPLGPVALWLGIKANKEGAGGTAVAGIVLGAVSTLWLVASFVFGIIYFAVFSSMMAAVIGSGGAGVPHP